MSYILEALRKSERERQEAEPLALNPIGSGTNELPHRRLAPLVGMAVLLVGAIALGSLWIFGAGRPRVTISATSLAVPPGESNTQTATVAATDVVSQRVANEARRPAPELKLSPFAAARQHSSLRDLAKEARVTPLASAAPTPRVSGSPSVAKTTAPAAAAADSPPEDEPIKFLRAMPPAFQHALPHLAVTIHIYAPHEADRILYINNRQYRIGDQIRDGIVVKEIVPDGVVLSYRGQLFKLPRPT